MGRRDQGYGGTDPDQEIDHLSKQDQQREAERQAAAERDTRNAETVAEQHRNSGGKY